MAESLRESARKEWRRPELQKLPIAATAQAKTDGSEGVGGGKGDSGPPVIS